MGATPCGGEGTHNGEWQDKNKGTPEATDPSYLHYKAKAPATLHERDLMASVVTQLHALGLIHRKSHSLHSQQPAKISTLNSLAGRDSSL